MACNTVKQYVDDVLGRYVVNVTTAAYVCSRDICHSNGRCRRQDPASGAYLHLDPSAWSIVPRSHSARGPSLGPAFRARRKPGVPQDQATKDQLLPFTCQCFPGWIGEHCSIKHKGWQIYTTDREGWKWDGLEDALYLCVNFNPTQILLNSMIQTFLTHIQLY